jgi:L-asparaginase
MTSAAGKSTVAVVATGGTIAGLASTSSDNLGYTAAQLGVQALIDAVPALRGQALSAEQLAQLDSKDMTHDTWHALARRVGVLLRQADVAGVVVTHGTDTLEETAWFLARVLVACKPVVLTAAMRPASSLQADGPQNLLDAIRVARSGGQGVLAVMAGQVLAGAEVRKVDTCRLDALVSVHGAPVARLEGERLRRLRDWPAAGTGLALAAPPWPWVEIVSSHAGVQAQAVQALVAAGVRGLVVAATGNGTVHAALEAALQQARAAGVGVLVATRCATGGIVGGAAGPLPCAGPLTPAQARIELMLRLMGHAAANFA